MNGASWNRFLHSRERRWRQKRRTDGAEKSARVSVRTQVQSNRHSHKILAATLDESACLFLNAHSGAWQGGLPILETGASANRIEALDALIERWFEAHRHFGP